MTPGEDAALWALEERFWREGAAESLDPACIMAFPPPTGLLSGSALGASLAAAPRWAAVTMTDRRAAHPAPGLAVLAYRARGRRDGGPTYEAFCTSCYRAVAEGWRLVQHQQTPVG
ncbi:DUF4440 domain-containing protein [Dankookia sp. GCM10030260]|uniref:DUF4440 domain-containing protein n=1 Tax=Dankookia sp. GCM10030260 TaxID=3273390 RepID=UPI00360E846B